MDGVGRGRGRGRGEILLSGEGEGDMTEIPVGFDDDEEEEEEENVEIKEEMIEEMMRWLESEISSPTTTSDFSWGTSFVTINGNEETCGPSFSDSASTVMASIDTRGVGGAAYFLAWPSDPADAGAATAGVGPWDGGVMWREAAVAAAAMEVEEGGDEDEDEDEEKWFARVISGNGLELEVENLSEDSGWWEGKESF